MTDNYTFCVYVEIYDKWQMEFDERGDALKKECVAAIEKILEEKGYRKYHDEYYVCSMG